MEIRLAVAKDKKKILKYDCHIHHNKVGECIYNGLVDVLCDGDTIVGVLRWNLFWHSAFWKSITIHPFPSII